MEDEPLQTDKAEDANAQQESKEEQEPGHMVKRGEEITLLYSLLFYSHNLCIFRFIPQSLTSAPFLCFNTC